MKRAGRERKIAVKIARLLSRSKNPGLAVSETGRLPCGAGKTVDTPEKAASCFGRIRGRKQECFAVLTLDAARRAINCHVVTVGTLTASLVHPREVFALALEDRAASIILAHNHPSGCLEASEQDRRVTGIFREAGEVMQIPLDDHLIVTEGGFASVPE